MDVLKSVALLMLSLALGGVHSGKIYGGHEAVAHSRPYMVILERLCPESNKAFCDGFLLNEDFVLTAAHCEASSYNVLFGVHNYYNRAEQNITVTQSFPHYNYSMSPYTLSHDIMLLKLSSKVKLSKHVRPIDLAGEDERALPGRCFVSGWGNPNRNSTYMSPKLMEVNVTLSDSPLCTKEHLYCCEGQNGPARGDSGGPLVCENGLAYGVVSYSTMQLNNEPLYAFTKIPDHKRWIDETLNYAGK
ncbi:granzyme B(G,H) [Lampris incognitus]|uniref:granzyme B(G,H) n=1 Tax=Lampris incognitus TaxID=2546036 RepID=UPI0024B613CC|nr:granzyme B(G,H) [Lampris incognitus]